MWTAKQHRCQRREQALVYLGSKCLDCGNSDHRVLEFHHAEERRNNGATVSALFQGSWKRLQKALDKCELLCANCHRIKTAQENKHLNRVSVGA
jgi:5-methylcytosine-specific restriction endonuclease McrA